jgi:hypothetical protein
MPVRGGSENALASILDGIDRETKARMKGEKVGSPPLVDFERMVSIHYARWVVMPNLAGDGQILALHAWYDGPIGDENCKEGVARAAHLREWTRVARRGLDEVYSNCVGYPGASAGDEAIIMFLEKAHISAGALYFGSPGRSRDQVRAEAELADKCRTWLDARPIGSAPATAEEVRAAVKGASPPLGPFPPQQKNWFTLACATLLAGPPLVAAGIAAAPVVTVKEHFDQELEPIYSEAERRHVEETTRGENEFFQNALSNVVAVKPGPFRLLLLRVVLFVIDTLARNYFVDGKLGSIPSIHAAHWYLLDGGKRLAFVSNYDSSWESYLGDFIDQASSGLTAVWSNTKGYPRTTLLLWAGSRAGDRFKAWSHHIQVKTPVWYAAYPWLSINNVNNNTQIRRGMADPTLDPSAWMGVL